jgi:transposase
MPRYRPAWIGRRDWVRRYNEAGVDGLVSRKPPGAAPKLSEAQTRELRSLVLAGPDPKTAKVVRWRCLDLREGLIQRFSVTMPERTIAKWLRKLKLIRLQPDCFAASLTTYGPPRRQVISAS